MVIDTSAIMAILQGEPDARALSLALEADLTRWMSAATFVELGIVASVRGHGGLADAERLVAEAGIEIVPVTAEHARLALQGYERFGKGRHPAGLNFGDCFSYALAKASQEPLLFKGADFAQTDVVAVTLPA